jgi:transposase InsO family protein
MKKEEIRKEFFKLRIKGHSYNQCRKILLTKQGYEIHNRTLQRWDERLRKRGIKHIRGAIHSPTTQGKVERLFQTFKREFKFCNKDSELWRMRYNHFRPHTSLEKKTPDEVYNDFKILLG